MAPLCQIQSLGKTYDKVHALSNIHLSIEAGEFISLIGPSGAGKTTLLRLLSGIEQPDQGTITFQTPEYRPVLVFQDFWLFPTMNVRHNIEFGLKAHRLPKSLRNERVNQVLEDFGLTAHAHKYPGQLSAGQQQRVALARALAIQPRLLLLDEPFAHLDRNLTSRTAAYLREIHNRYNLTTVAVTHNQEEAFQMSDRIGVIMDGNLVQCDTPEKLVSHPANYQTAAFLGPLEVLPPSLSPYLAHPSQSNKLHHYYRPHRVNLSSLDNNSASPKEAYSISRRTVPQLPEILEIHTRIRSTQPRDIGYTIRMGQESKGDPEDQEGKIDQDEILAITTQTNLSAGQWVRAELEVLTFEGPGK